MSYQIHYAPQMNKKYPKFKQRKIVFRRQLLIPIVIIALMACIAIRPVRDWLFPGDPDVTDAATREMLNSLRSGDRIEEAITVFCLEVLKDGTKD